MGDQSKRSLSRVLLGAAFLMATSAIGPGFLTQTAVFTDTLRTSMAFAILVSILFDLGAQLNIWRVITLTGRRAQDLANDVLPGMGFVLAGLVVLGGLAFNVGNIAGAGLGLNVITGMSVTTGALISAAFAIAIFVMKDAARAMDRFVLVMGFVMVALTVYVAISSNPPIAQAALHSVFPENIKILPIVTLVGGTVGGYITFAGAHRLIDAGVKGPEAQKQVSTSAWSAIGIASLMRVVLFLAALGVVTKGLALDPANPPASVFRHATGNVGYRIFGVVMWAAAITSVVGAAFTSVSFIRTFSPRLEERWKTVVIGFIVVSTAVFIAVGRPVKVLILVGALNALVLPIALGVMLVAANTRRIMGDYRHPPLMTAAGVIVAVSMAVMGGWMLFTEIPKLMR